MAVEIDFQPYLQSVSTHYEQWWQLYTLTDAQTQAKQQNEPQPWKTPFDFGLMVQTVKCDRSVEMEGSGVEPQAKDKIERFPVLEGIRKYVKEHRQVLLVGRPGSGKSTTLARLLLEEARDVEDPPSPLKKGEPEVEVPLFKGDLGGSRGIGDSINLIPVLVELRFLSNSTLLDRIQASFLRHDPHFDCTKIKDLLLNQRLLLLMDGLNELPSEAARQDVTRFLHDHPKVSMIFTTRDLSLGGDFGLEKKLEMQPLTEAQMQAFVRSYLPEQAEAMLRQLKDRLREFGQTPLLLWMLCGLFQKTGQIPTNLGEVFRAFTQGYEKNLKADVPVESDRRWWPELLQELAFWMMRGVPYGQEAPAVDVEFRVAISKSEVYQIFSECLKKIEEKPDGAARKSLNDLLRHHLIQINGDLIEFRHQLIQEYYAAEYLLGHWDQFSEFEFKRNYLNYLKWMEPVSLTLGLIQDRVSAIHFMKIVFEVDMILGASIAGDIGQKFQSEAIDLIDNISLAKNISPWLKTELLRKVYRFEPTLPTLPIHPLSPPKEIDQYSKRLPKFSTPISMSIFENLSSPPSRKFFIEIINSLEDPSSYIHLLKTGAARNVCAQDAAYLVNMGNPISLIQCIAASTLRAFSVKAAVPALIRTLESPTSNSDVRCEVAQTLGAFSAKAAVPALIRTLESPTSNSDVRREVAHALGNIRSEVAVPTLVEALTDPCCHLREAALEALRSIGIGNEDIIPTLIKMLEEDSESDIRHIAAMALGDIGNESAISCLVNALRTSDPFLRWRIVQQLGRIDNIATIPALL